MKRFTSASFPDRWSARSSPTRLKSPYAHHALESGCFVVNATGWLSDEQIAQITPEAKLQKALRGGCCTAIISPEGAHLCDKIVEGEGMAIADLDFNLITKRKRMMDSVGHYARPELLSLVLNASPATPMELSTTLLTETEQLQTKINPAAAAST